MTDNRNNQQRGRGQQGRGQRGQGGQSRNQGDRQQTGIPMITKTCPACGWKQTVPKHAEAVFAHCPRCTRKYSEEGVDLTAYVSIVCPDCGKPYLVLKEEVVKGAPRCPYCAEKMTCSHCGTENRVGKKVIEKDGEVFCFHCGRSLKSGLTATEMELTDLTCPACGHVRRVPQSERDEIRLCENCGFGLQSGKRPFAVGESTKWELPTQCSCCGASLRVNIAAVDEQGHVTARTSWMEPEWHRHCRHCGEVMPEDFNVDICPACGYDNDVNFHGISKAGCPTCGTWGEIDTVLASQSSKATLTLHGSTVQVDNLIALFVDTGNVSKVDIVFRGDEEAAKAFYAKFCRGWMQRHKNELASGWHYRPWVLKDQEAARRIVEAHTCAWKGCPPDSRLVLITEEDEKKWQKRKAKAEGFGRTLARLAVHGGEAIAAIASGAVAAGQEAKQATDEAVARAKAAAAKAKAAEEEKKKKEAAAAKNQKPQQKGGDKTKD